jgi:hypothetical protein
LFLGDILVSGLIDYETLKWINLTIVASDNGIPFKKHSLLHFYCKVEDLNDNEPKFIENSRTEFSIYEDAIPLTVVYQFKAVDVDSGQFGVVYYKILSGDEGKFAIDSQNGTLYLKSPVDREIQDLYTLVIQAKDNPTASISQQLTDSILVKVRILDVNDNKPYCERDLYTVEIMQNLDINTTLLQIKGFDLDLDKNANLVYSLSTNDTLIAGKLQYL